MSAVSIGQIDAVLNLICAISMLLTLLFNLKLRSASLAEKRLNLFLLVVFLITSVRAYSYFIPSGQNLSILLLCFAASFPLVIVLFSEGMIRKHAPMIVKIGGVLGTAITLICIAVLGSSNPITLWVLIISQIIGVASFMYMGLRPKPGDLTPDEEQLIRLLFISAVFAIPLIVTDFRDLFGWNFPRMGALAPMLVLSAVQASMRHESSKAYIARLLLHAAVVIGFCYLVFADDWVKLSSFCLSLMLMTRNIERLFLKDPHGINHDFWQVFRNWVSLEKPDVKTLSKNLEERKILIWGPEHFEGYDQELIGKYLSTAQRITLSEARAQVRRGENREVHEQIVDLLETNDMNLILLINSNPLSTVIANVPLTLGSRPLELENITLQGLNIIQGRNA